MRQIWHCSLICIHNGKGKIAVRELLFWRYFGVLGMKKKVRKLGKVQKKMRENSENKVLRYIRDIMSYQKNSSIPYFLKIKKDLKMDNSVLRKTLDRLIAQRKLREVRLESRSKKEYYDKYGSGYFKDVVLNYKGYRETTKDEKNNNLSLKILPSKEILDQKREKLEKIKHNKGNPLLKKWTGMSKKHRNSFVRDEIFESMIKIDYLGKNEEKILKELGLLKKTYESWIKKSSRLQWLRNKLIEYKNKNQQLPLEIRYGEYWIIGSLTMQKRHFQFQMKPKIIGLDKKS